LDYLNLCLKANPEYLKGFLNRATVNQALGNYQEAVQDLQRAKELDVQKQFGVDGKLKDAKQKAKQNSRKDYYAILGVDKNFTEKDLKTAYKKLALKHHPDRQTEEQRAKAEKIFKDVNEAYSVLSDPNKKRQYDLGVDPNGGGASFDPSGFGGNIDPNEIFKMFMGGGGMGGMGGSN